MSIQVTVLTERVDAAPGEVAAVQLALHNDGTSDASVRIRVVGLDSGTTRPTDHSFNVPPGVATTCFVPVDVPAGLGVGEHAAGLEVHTDRPGSRATLAAFTVAVASVERVELTPLPSTVRGRRRGKLRVDVANFEPVPVELDLRGESPEAVVRFRPPRVRVLPGQRALVAGRVVGPRRWAGEPTQHTLVITGQGRASATTATAVFVQRPLFARKLRGGLAALLVIALWLGAIGGFIWWWRDRGDDGQIADGAYEALDTDGDGVPDLFVGADGSRVTAVDTDGDGVPDLFTLPDGRQVRGVDTDGDGDPDSFTDASGNPVPDPRGGGSGGGGGAGGDGDVAAGGGAGGSGGSRGSSSRTPTAAVVRGTIRAAGSLDDISITLSPISLAQPSAAAAPQALAGSGPGESLGTPTTPPPKLWPARLGVVSAGALDGRRQTEPLRPLPRLAGAPQATAPQPDGVWLFTDVPLRQSYELTFAKPGFDTQSFVVTPPDDGSATELDVELKPATGSLAGRVMGPGGPLGGVEITVTDGTLTFTTTTATVGDIGSWSVEQVSTPAVYTITGVRRGYGTEVRQVEVGAGQQLTGADLTMRAGVGSIAGRVLGPNGSPLGGVTITATADDQTFTTSSLTEGNIGFYNLPQLPAPGTYTVSVALDGYLTQTRRVGVGGAIGGVDFTLTRTTVRLTGTVLSAGDGKGIPNAGLTLSTGDLTFKVATAGAPNTGTFEIADLPPGNYTVRVEHYQHDTSTQFVTLTAGVAPPPLEITLTPNGGIPAIGTGSLVVEVVDPSGETAERREIKNATVRLVNLQTGEVVRELTQEAFDFELTDIPVGTYTVQVSAPRYNPAAPRRVSIGLSQTRVQVELLRLGQASGRVIDSLTDARLTGYFVSLYRQPESPGDAPVFTLPSRADGSWQTPPDSLIPGTYRIEITDNASPAGYLVRPDQLLDEAVVGATPESRFMRFVLPLDATDPVVVRDIEADPYPTITGRVYKPTIDSGALIAETSLVPIDSNALSVTIACTDGSTPYTVPLLDQAGVAGNDSFSIGPDVVDAQNLTGTCTVTASEPGRTTATATLADVDASDGNSRSDRRIHMTVAKPAPPIGGSVFWLNGVDRVPLEDVNVSGTPITEFTSQESALANDPAPPVPPAPRSTTSGPDGLWDLDGQLFGVTTYTFDAAGFRPGTISVRVDDDGARASAGSNTDVDTTPDGRFDVQLTAADPHTINGSLRIHTISTATIPWATFTLTATAPDGDTVAAGSCAGSAPAIDRSVDDPLTPKVLEFEICNATPGDWSVTVNQPTGYTHYGTVPATDLIEPVAGGGPLPVALAELADLRVTLVDSAGAPLAFDDDDLTLTLTGASATPDPVADATNPNIYTVGNIRVAANEPETTPEPYTLEIELDGFDVPNATYTIGTETDVLIGSDLALPVEFRAGELVEVTIEMPKYAGRVGEVFGQDDYDSYGSELTAATGLVVTVEPVDIAGNSLGAAEPIDLSGNSFTLTGPPGYYRVVASHPTHLPQPLTGSPAGTGVPADTLPDASGVVGVFRLINDDFTPLGNWELRARTGELDLTVLDSLDGGMPVPGASYFLYDDNDELLATTDVAQPALDADGHALIEGLLPGSYTLKVRRFADPAAPTPVQVAFPTILSFSIGASTESETSRVVVRAPLPPLAPTVTGHIIATNEDTDKVILPPPPVDGSWTYEVDVTYTVPSAEVDGTLVPNEIEDGDAVGVCFDGFTPDINDESDEATCSGQVTATYNTGDITYKFEYVPFGRTYVTLSQATIAGVEAAGYDLLNDDAEPGFTIEKLVDIDGPNEIAQPFEFRARNVAVVVTLGPSGYFDDVAATLTRGSASFPGTHINAANGGNTVSFANVPPQLTPYTFNATAALHELDTPASIQVDPAAGGTVPHTLAPAMEAVKGRVAGVVMQVGAGEPQFLQGGGRVALYQGATEIVGVDGPLPNGQYELDAEAGSYTLRVTQTDFPPKDVPVTITNGTVRTENVEITQRATYTVQLTNGAGLTAPDVELRSGTTVEDCDLSSGTTFVCDVPAGTYELWARGSNYDDTRLAQNINLQPGTQATAPHALPRRIAVSVVNSGSQVLSGVTMKVFRASAPTVQVGPDFTVPGTITLPAALNGATEGDLELQFSLNGYRTRRVTYTMRNPSTMAPVLQGTTSPTLWPLADLSEAITGATGIGSDDAFLTAVAQDSPTVTASTSITCNGGGNQCQYEVDDLGTRPNGDSRTWVITYDKLGVGRVTTNVVVSATGAVGSPVLAVVEQPINVTFTVNNGGPLSGATVKFGETLQLVQNTGGNGQATFAIPERQLASWASDSARKYEITHPDYGTRTGTAPAFTQRSISVDPVTLPTTTTTTTSTTTTSTTLPPSTTAAPTTATATSAAPSSAPDSAP